MKLVVVESPAKCQKIQSYLGSGFMVKASFGHFRDLDKKNMGINTDDGSYTPNYIIISDKKKVVADLKAAYKKCDKLILAADGDAEGEAIAFHLNETLNNGKDNHDRIIFNEITKTALTNAVKNPTKININKFHAQQARRVLDRIIGFMITPCLWKNIQSNYKKGESLSSGRVQSIVNRIIIERENEIKNFEKKEYFNISGNLDYKGNNIEIKYEKKINKLEDVYKIFELTKENDFIITKIEKKDKKEKAKAPFITSSLQQEAHNKLGMNAKRTMLIAQKLYENGKITYMRTDSINISKDALKDIKNEILECYGEKYFSNNTFKTKTKNAQEAHEAIRVTNIQLHDLNDDYDNDMKRLYSLIWKRTISSQMSDCKKEILEIKINLDKYIFIATNERILFDGFQKVYNIVDKNSKILQELKEKTKLDLKDLKSDAKFTKPEPRFNDASLVQKLEKLGIGRPSTYSNMVSSVIDKNYAVIKDCEGIDMEVENLSIKKGEDIKTKKEIIQYGADKKKITPTETGIMINDYLLKYFEEIINYDFTANMELELDKIENENANWNGIVDIIYKKLLLFINNTPKSNIIHNSDKKQLGINPNTNLMIEIYVGKFGLCIHEIAETGKGRFIGIKDSKLEDVTLDKAIELFKYPYVLFNYQNKDVYLNKGQYGLYIKYDNKNYSVKDLDENNIDFDSVKKLLIDNKNNGLIRKLNKDIEIHNGTYGYYIKYKTKNYAIKITNNLTPNDKIHIINNMNVDDCLNIINKKTKTSEKQTKTSEKSEKTTKKSEKTTKKSEKTTKTSEKQTKTSEKSEKTTKTSKKQTKTSKKQTKIS